MKKVFSILIILYIMINSIIIANASWMARTNYNEHTPSEWAEEAAYTLRQYGYIGMDNLYWDDYRNMSGYRYDMRRDYIVNLMIEMYEHKKGEKVEVPINTTFQKWDYLGFEDSVKKAQSIGLVNGRSETDFGYTSVTREEMVTMVYRLAILLGETDELNLKTTIFADDSFISDWAKVAVQFVSSFNIMQGASETTFSPQGLVTKEMAYTIMHRFAIKFGVYERLAEDVIAKIDFTPKKDVVGDVDRLYSVISPEEKAIIEKAMNLFGDYYQMYIRLEDSEYVESDNYNNLSKDDFFKGKEEGEYARIYILSKKGDFLLHLNKKGIFASLKVSNNDFEQYKPLINNIMKLTEYKGEYSEKVQKMREKAIVYKDDQFWNNEDYANFFEIGVDYDELYEGICVNINELYIG